VRKRSITDVRQRTVTRRTGRDLTHARNFAGPDGLSDVFATFPGMGHALGYARISTSEQDPALQHDALREAGCWRIFTDTASGSHAGRPQLAALLDQLRPGDVLVVWRLDRLGRSVRDLIDTIAELDDRGVGFRSLQEAIDTTTAGGRLLLHVFASLAQFESELLRERTVAGLAAARARGRRGGRPTIMTAAKTQTARSLLAEGRTITEIAQILGVARTTVYRHLDQAPAAV
jgi:DNA invertase Pin-like site-specific DNA recombinase